MIIRTTPERYRTIAAFAYTINGQYVDEYSMAKIL